MKLNQIDHHKYPSLDAFENSACDEIINFAQKCISLRGKFLIVLCGGNTPRGIFKKLSKRNTDWSKWFIFYGDERCLKVDDPNRNSVMANNSWLGHTPIPKNQIYTINGELGAIQAASEYNQLLSDVGLFDLVLLGLGEDGHIASLFPGHKWDNSRYAVPIENAPKPPSKRVSMTSSRLSNSRNIIFLVTGKNKQLSFERWKKQQDLPCSTVCAKEQMKIFSFDLI